MQQIEVPIITKFKIKKQILFRKLLIKMCPYKRQNIPGQNMGFLRKFIFTISLLCDIET